VATTTGVPDVIGARDIRRQSCLITNLVPSISQNREKVVGAWYRK
jgi:hypothetical protein